MKEYSIEGQLKHRIILLTALVIILSAILADYTVTHSLQRDFDKVLETKARVLVTLTKELPDGVEFDFADEFMPEFEREKNPAYFQLWTNGYKNFERSHSLKGNDIPYQMMDVAGKIFKNIVLVDGRHGRMVQIVFIPQIPEAINRTDEALAKQKLMTLIVAVERDSLDQKINSVHIIALLSALMILALIYFIVIHTVRNSLKSLADLKEKVKTMDVDSLSLRLNAESSPEELRDVIDQFNELLLRLEKSFAREQRFSSDVAHELRTPISEIRSMSEIALKWPDDTKLMLDFHGGILASSKQMQCIVNSLLELVRCENGQLNLQPKEVLLNESVDECWQHYKSLGEDKQLKFISDIPDDLSIITSVMEFEIILRNLISNAVNYSESNSEIKVSATVINKQVNLIIQNATEAIDKDDVLVMFDKLWRKSKSRSSSDHAGLGLSIVKAYGQALGLKVCAEYSKPNTFTISLQGLHYVG